MTTKVKVTEEKKGDGELIVREIVTIGSDPEFAIVQPNSARVLNASDVFRPENPHDVNCDFGYDGHSATGEIRPKPTDTPKKAVQLIKKLLEKNKKKYPQAYQNNLMATSNRLSLGGHIHFGNKKLINGSSISPLGMVLVHNLDNLLAFPSMYLENKEHGLHRRGTSYGGFSDARKQPWGFEYRTLSSFIASKELTSAVFYLGYAIADATLNFKYKSKDIVRKDGFSYAFQNQHRELLKPHLKYVFKQHINLPLYKEKKDYKENIDFFDEAVKKQEPLFNTEIKEGWHIEFDIADFWKVERLETLLEKVTKMLVAIHTLKRKTFSPVSFKFVSGSVKDTGCPEIAKRVNIALNNLIDKEVLKSQQWRKLRVYGLRESRGNEVWIHKQNIENKKRKKQVLAYLWEIASEFSHDTKITEMKFVGDMNPFSMAFGRRIREENLLLAEAMVVITLLMMNQELFKQTQKDKKGKKRKLLVTKHKVVNPVVKEMKKVKEVKPKKPNHDTSKINGISIPTLFDLDRSYNEMKARLLSLDEEEKGEMYQICKELFFGTLEPTLNSECIAKCEEKGSLKDMPLIDLCPNHLSRALVRVISVTLPHYMGNWENIFKPTRPILCEPCATEYPHNEVCRHCLRCENCCECYTCEECGTKVSPDDYCGDCSRCNECWYRCENCEEHECSDACDCSYCEHCSHRVGYDNYCSDCDSCSECWEHCQGCGECREICSSCSNCEDCQSHCRECGNCSESYTIGADDMCGDCREELCESCECRDNRADNCACECHGEGEES